MAFTDQFASALAQNAKVLADRRAVRLKRVVPDGYAPVADGTIVAGVTGTGTKATIHVTNRTVSSVTLSA